MSESRLEHGRRARLADLVAFARANSPFYKQLYDGLPDRIEDAGQLPVTKEKFPALDRMASDGSLGIGSRRLGRIIDRVPRSTLN